MGTFKDCSKLTDWLKIPLQGSENPEETCYLAPGLDDDEEEITASQVF